LEAEVAALQVQGAQLAEQVQVLTDKHADRCSFCPEKNRMRAPLACGARAPGGFR
jgi:hypothetical protein